MNKRISRRVGVLLKSERITKSVRPIQLRKFYADADADAERLAAARIRCNRRIRFKIRQRNPLLIIAEVISWFLILLMRSSVT